MGQHKLLLPWNNDRVIDHVLQAWTSCRVSQTVVVIRNDDPLLVEACRNWPVTICSLDADTEDMKTSIQYGLSFVKQTWQPADTDHCLFAPADLPRLTSEVIDLVIDSANGSEQIVAPYVAERRRHPVSFPWNTTRAVFELGPDEGLNAILDRSEIKRVELDRKFLIDDIDTRADYLREIELARIR